MADNKTVTRSRAADKPRKTKELRKLLKQAQEELAEAQEELARLVEYERAGRLTNRKLKTGLKEVEAQVKRILVHKKAFV